MTVGLSIAIESNNDVTIVRIEGRLDAASSPILERKLLEQVDGGVSEMLLDFSLVNYLSSAGMRLLLSMTKKMKGKGGALHCCSVGEEVMEIIKMAGFERIIHIFSTEQEALQNFSK